MAEAWLPVCGFEGFYEVSNLGRVRSVDRTVTRDYGDGRKTTVRRRGAIMKFDYRDGYATVRMQAEGRSFKAYVHRLVCAAFNGPQPTPEKIMVAHNDGDFTNNTPENVRWATPTENQRDREGHVTHNRGERSHLRKLTWDDVSEIRESSEPNPHVARRFGVTSANIRMIRRMKTWIPL